MRGVLPAFARLGGHASLFENHHLRLGGSTPDHGGWHENTTHPMVQGCLVHLPRIGPKTDKERPVQWTWDSSLG